ncbi:MAG: amidohydrolase [Cyclobacteriaceae bacterium]
MKKIFHFLPSDTVRDMALRYGHWLAVNFFLIAVLPGCWGQKEQADTILINGKVITVDGNFSITEAVALKNGRILETGDTQHILDLTGGSTKIINLKGHTVIPGLNEGHAHPIAASQSEYLEPIPDVHTIEDVLTWVREQTERKSDDEWIIHPKFFITRLDDMREITKKELDDAAPRHPVFLNGSYGGLINSKALRLSKMMDIKHPGILRHEKTGQPTGVILRSAFKLLALPQAVAITEEQKAALLKEQLHLYNSIGITSVCSGGGTMEELKAFEDLMSRNELTVRIFHNIRVPFDLKQSQDEMLEDLQKLAVKTGDGNEWVKVGALKVVLDGGMLTGTAFLHEGWGEKAKKIYGISDPSYRGELFISKEELTKVVAAGLEAGWKFTAHVTGGAGVDTLLAAYEDVNRIKPIKGRRFSIIHGNFFTSEAIEKMVKLGVYADMQPAWFFKDTDLLHRVLGTERIKTFHPYGALTEAGVLVNGGSDHMVKVDPDLSINPYNPFMAMWSVVTRKTEKGTVFNPEQSVSREEALKMYTINNAYASFEEDLKGSIEKGKLADLVVLSQDILTCHEDSIRVIRPLLTVVNGETVFDNGELKVETRN